MFSRDLSEKVTATTSSSSGKAFGYVDIAAVLVGLVVAGYGLLLVPQSALGGLWIAAIGVSLLLAGVFNTQLAGDRFGVSARNRRTLTLSFATLTVVLLVLFVVIGGFGVEGSFVTEASSSGGN